MTHSLQIYPTFACMGAYHFFLPALICLFVNARKVCAQTDPELTRQRVEQALVKKAEYHKLTDGEREGYRIKIHFGLDREAAETVRGKFSSQFPGYNTYKDYQQPNFVVLVGDFRTKLEAFESLKKIKGEFPNAFIVKGRIVPE